MKTPQNSRRKRCQLQAHTLTTAETQKLVPIYFFVKFSQAAKSNTKTCGSTSLQDSLVVFAIIFEHLLWFLSRFLFRWLLLLYKNRLHYPWGKCLKQGARQTQGNHIRSLILLFPLHYEAAISMGAVLQKCRICLQPAVSLLSTRPGFQYCIPSYFELTGNPEPHSALTE